MTPFYIWKKIAFSKIKDMHVPYSILSFHSLVSNLCQLQHFTFDSAFAPNYLTRVMRAAVSIPAVASASVLHSAAVGGSVVGVVRPL